jgi:hypothetical protein
VGKRGKRIEGRGYEQLRLPASDLLTLTTEELYSMSLEQLQDLAKQVVLAPGVVLSNETDKRQVLCRLIQSAIEVK